MNHQKEVDIVELTEEQEQDLKDKVREARQAQQRERELLPGYEKVIKEHEGVKTEELIDHV